CWVQPSATRRTASRRRASFSAAVVASMVRINYHTRAGTHNPDYLRVSSSAERWQSAKSKLVNTPFGAPRLLALLTRWLVFLGLPGGFAYLCYRFFALREGLWCCVLFPMLLCLQPWCQWFWEFLVVEFRLLFSYRANRSAYATQYADRISYAILS